MARLARISANNELMLLDLQTFNRTRLMQTDGWEWQIAWSPDGTAIAYTTIGLHETGQIGLFLVNLEGEPIWSPIPGVASVDATISKASQLQ